MWILIYGTVLYNWTSHEKIFEQVNLLYREQRCVPGLKNIQSVTSSVNDSDKIKLCMNCYYPATEIAYFDVGHALVIERYCRICIKTRK